MKICFFKKISGEAIDERVEASNQHEQEALVLTDRARQLESDEEVETAAADASEEADGKSLYARSDLVVYMLYRLDS